jgi:serine/threonine protein kinase
MRSHCGTRSYMAPEMFKQRFYNAAVDIWSLGVVVYELAHGLPRRGREWEFDGIRWTEKIVRSPKNATRPVDAQNWQMHDISICRTFAARQQRITRPRTPKRRRRPASPSIPRWIPGMDT